MVSELFVEATNHCNGQCLFCWHDEMKYPRGYADPELYTRLVIELKPKRTWIQHAGEPSLHPRLGEIVTNCRGTAAMVTNGALLTPELGDELIRHGLTWIIFSVVSAQALNYRRINGLELIDVLDNMKAFRIARDQWTSGCRITARILLCEENLHEFSAMRKLWRSYSDDVHVVPEFKVPFKDRNGVDSTWKLNCHLSRKLWKEGVVKWDGTVVPCCRDMDAWHPMGVVYDRSFDAIYRGPEFNEFRKAVLSEDPPAICEGCYLRPSPLFKSLARRLKL